MILFDLDGVLRDLTAGISQHLGRPFDPPSWNQDVLPGVDLCEYIDRHPSILLSSPATEYVTALCYLEEVTGETPTIMTCQPLPWILWTREWIRKNVNASVIFCHSPQEKLERLKPGDLLVEDYPGFACNGQIVMVDRPYNRHVQGCAARVGNVGELIAIIREMVGRA